MDDQINGFSHPIEGLKPGCLFTCMARQLKQTACPDENRIGVNFVCINTNNGLNDIMVGKGKANGPDGYRERILLFYLNLSNSAITPQTNLIYLIST